MNRKTEFVKAIDDLLYCDKITPLCSLQKHDSTKLIQQHASYSLYMQTNFRKLGKVKESWGRFDNFNIYKSFCLIKVENTEHLYIMTRQYKTTKEMDSFKPTILRNWIKIKLQL